MKKIIIIDGTHNKKGNTVALIDSFISGVKVTNPHFHIVHYNLVNEDVKYCRGCGNCTLDQNTQRGVCTIIDDKGYEIINEALSADIIVFATPIYEYCVSSTMKRFLERCLPLGKFSFGIIPRIKTDKTKKAIIICVSGAPFPFNFLMGIAIYPKFILTKIAKFFGCGDIKSIFAGGMTGNEKMKQKYLKNAFELGINI